MVGAHGQGQVGAGQLGARRPVDPPGLLGGQPAQLAGAAEPPQHRLQQGQVGGGGEGHDLAAPPPGVGPGQLQVGGGVLQLAAPELGRAEQGLGQRPLVVVAGGPLDGRFPGPGQQHPGGRPGVGGVADQPGPVQPGQVQRRPGQGMARPGRPAEAAGPGGLPGEPRLGSQGQPQPGVGLLQLAHGEAAQGGHHGQLRGCPHPVAGQPRHQLPEHGRLSLDQHRRPARGQEGGRLVEVAGGQGVA
ncbi:MAG TPA: hypothetical protein VE265_05930, partial [Actinomycetota bacterium]|nr:hypothetical protein [Actinomycetota bacterium]